MLSKSSRFNLSSNFHIIPVSFCQKRYNSVCYNNSLIRTRLSHVALIQKNSYNSYNCFVPKLFEPKRNAFILAVLFAPFLLVVIPFHAALSYIFFNTTICVIYILYSSSKYIFVGSYYHIVKNKYELQKYVENNEVISENKCELLECIENKKNKIVSNTFDFVTHPFYLIKKVFIIADGGDRTLVKINKEYMVITLFSFLVSFIICLILDWSDPWRQYHKEHLETAVYFTIGAFLTLIALIA